MALGLWALGCSLWSATSSDPWSRAVPHLVDLCLTVPYTYASKGSPPTPPTLHTRGPPMASDLFTGSLDILILKAVSWGPRHGYAVGRWIRETTAEVLDVQEGALYPALHRLERRGLLSEEWGQTETGREAKFYTLTPAG